jgi:hypothetical protein
MAPLAPNLINLDLLTILIFLTLTFNDDNVALESVMLSMPPRSLINSSILKLIFVE